MQQIQCYCIFCLLARWTAHSGKFNRCQLGHFEQLHQTAKLKALVVEVAQKRCQEPDVSQLALTGADSAETSDVSLDPLLVVCTAVLKQPGNEDLEKEAQSKLFHAGLHNQMVATILLNLGYTPRSKFPEIFDTRKACELAYLCLSDFLSRAFPALRLDLWMFGFVHLLLLLWLVYITVYSIPSGPAIFICAQFWYSMVLILYLIPHSSFLSDLDLTRQGNAANIHDSSTDAWKRVVADALCEAHQTSPLGADLLAKEDVLDAHSWLKSLEQQRDAIQKQSHDKFPKFVSGRRPKTDLAEIAQAQRLTNVKKHLKQLAESGNAVAAEAVEKIHKATQKEPDPERAEAEGNRPKRRIRRKTKQPDGTRKRYHRAQGDELRLIRKREIVPRHLLLYSILV